MSLSEAEHKLLTRELDLLGQTTSVPEYSYRRCSAIGEKTDLNQEEQDQFEAFTSRFARLYAPILLDSVGRLKEYCKRYQ